VGVCLGLLLGVLLTAHRYETEHFVPRSELETKERGLQRKYELTQQHVDRLIGDADQIAQDLEETRRQQARASESVPALERGLAECQSSVRCLESKVEAITDWEKGLASASELLLNLEPVIMYLAGASGADRVSRRLTGRMADLRAWHREQGAGLGGLVAALMALGEDAAHLNDGGQEQPVGRG